MKKINFEDLMVFVFILCAYLVFLKQVMWAISLMLLVFIFYSLIRVIIYAEKILKAKNVVIKNHSKVEDVTHIGKKVKKYPLAS